MQSVTRSGIFGFDWPSPSSAATPADSEHPISSPPPPTRAGGGRVPGAGSSERLTYRYRNQTLTHLLYGDTDTACVKHTQNNEISREKDFLYREKRWTLRDKNCNKNCNNKVQINLLRINVRLVQAKHNLCDTKWYLWFSSAKLWQNSFVQSKYNLTTPFSVFVWTIPYETHRN